VTEGIETHGPGPETEPPILGGSDGAAEVVEEAFVRTLARWGASRRHDDPLPYVRSAVINLCRSRFRRRVLPLRPAEIAPSAEATAAGNARRDAVLTALATLREQLENQR
jgi:DNA-directed RNA polymerase specialized sigma24 family protein